MGTVRGMAYPYTGNKTYAVRLIKVSSILASKLNRFMEVFCETGNSTKEFRKFNAFDPGSGVYWINNFSQRWFIRKSSNSKVPKILKLFYDGVKS